jgi:CheY-like chemotaxis protein
VLLNLLSNAVKYNRPSGTVRVRCRATDDDRLRIEVADEGGGVAPDRMERLFAPFDRLGAELTEVEGTGLGLVLSKHLVEAMGGAIDVQSTPGTGSTFSIELGLTENPDLLPEAIPVRAARTEDIGAGVWTVLYIEDNPANLRLVERVLADRGDLSLISAMDGKAGLDLARHRRPDLVLMDLHLPDIQGQEILRSLRIDPRTSDIPVVVISADATPGQVERLLDAGARDYITKPINVHRFLEVIDEILIGVANEPAGAAHAELGG